MRRKIFYLFIILAAIAIVGCREQMRNKVPKTSIGEPYELFVICNNNHWEEFIQPVVSLAFEGEVPGLSRPEKYFHVIDHKSFKDVNDVERKHSNILAVRVDPTNNGTTITVAEDVKATQQVMVEITAQTAADAAQYIYNNAWELREIFENNERIIHHSVLNASSSKAPMDIIRETTGIAMHVPGGFSVANPKEDRLKWFVRKYANKQQHIFVFTEPCDDIATVSKAHLENSIDRHIGIISVKDEEGSYMCISKNRASYLEARDINGRTWYELRCCWRVEGYTMGGPMVSYSTYDEANKRMITIIFALFSPELMQRHDMAQLESLIYLTE